MSLPFTSTPKVGHLDYAVYSIFPSTVGDWQKWFLAFVLGAIILYAIMIAVNPANPFYTTVKNVSLAILPFVYIGWSIVSRPSIALYYRTLGILLLSLTVTLIAKSVGSPGAGSWAEKWKTFLGNTFEALLQASFFAVPYIATSL